MGISALTGTLTGSLIGDSCGWDGGFAYRASLRVGTAKAPLKYLGGTVMAIAVGAQSVANW